MTAKSYSLAEGRGSEPPVPLAKRIGLSGGTGSAADAKRAGRGTEGSNLACSSGESVANHGDHRAMVKPSFHAVHSVAAQTKARTTALTRSTCPQRILVAFMATKDQRRFGDGQQAQNWGERATGCCGAQIGQL